MAMPQQGFQFGSCPNARSTGAPLAAGYTFLVLVILLLINWGLLFPDSSSSSSITLPH